MKKTKLAVIFGGKSSEYLISLHSAASAIKNIPNDKFDVTLIGITSEGKWLYFPGSIEEIDNNTWFENPNCCEMILSPDAVLKGFIKLNNDKTFDKVEIDCVFPILHGKHGEDGTIQGLCELYGIPFVGCDMLSSALCMDKEFTHIVCNSKNIKMAPYMAVVNEKNLDLKDTYKKVLENLSLPIFIKPANAGSSYGISKIRNYDEFEKGMNFAFDHDRKVILESTIEGFEIGCAVLGNGEILIGEVDEIEMYKDFFDYNEKYHSTTSKIHCPARISDELKLEAKETAKCIYKALECSGMARIDMFLTPTNEIILNEVNTIPGLTSVSRYPSMVKVGLNMGYTELIIELVNLAMNR
ncbi:D-alanine--D-alanine ligase [Sedimentibacter sp. zth1]|uniref:D-alanine--D-alanine ligase family protein n=1 Tax=Sedimentibacter sp. zth1 TaxID=2816908 RepID=UPI001A933A66|nr:D-alanine--D-alanine ligase family protein [Sedimentibacter sp. zth1]QSX05154.1 D-alanine--D-alanine ligase [Sedimentibacter sp. zth1]